MSTGPVLSLSRFEEQLVGRSPRAHKAAQRAAVAALLRFERSGAPEVLLMRRAIRQGDRWSGQVSFPGGKEESDDPDLRATAQRETEEELGFSLASCSRFLGPLDVLPAMSRGRILETSIAPFVYLQTTPPTIQPGPEAAHAFWLPLSAAAGGVLDSTFHYDTGSTKIPFPCWRFEQEVIWGLTFKMLQSLLALVADAGRGSPPLST